MCSNRSSTWRVMPWAFLCLLFPMFAWATNLEKAYQQAQAHDPTFRAARARWLAAGDAFDAEKAMFWPQLSLAASMARKKTSSSSQTSHTVGVRGYQVTISQTLFDLSQWALTQTQQATFKAEAASYAASAQALMVQVADAYFSVLTALSHQTYLQAETVALNRRLKQVQQRYKAGLTTRTDVYDVKAAYATRVADKIVADNEVINRFMTLKRLTGHLDRTFDALKPLTIPNEKLTQHPIQYWQQYARQYNHRLLAAYFKSISAKEAIKKARAGYYPTIHLEGTYMDTHDASFLTQKNMQAGIQASWALWNGGATHAQTRQARHVYDQRYENWRNVRESLQTEVYQTYLGIQSGHRLLRADQQTLHAAHMSFKSTEKRYQAGIRTMRDMLEAQSLFYAAKKRLIDDQYHYVHNILALKKLTGQLKVSDLRTLDRVFSQKRHI